MTKITFPFCLVTARQGDVSLPISPMANYVAAFSTVEKAAAYMFQRGSTDWRMTLVSRPTFDATVASLRLLGVEGLAFDPEGNEPGTKFDFEAISCF